MGDLSTGTPPSKRPAEDRLDSWKEIATYVKRDLTTVQRWEKREGMPVHRHVHDKRGSGYAFSSELDTWLQSRRLRLEEEEKEPLAETRVDAESDRRPRGTPHARRWFVLGAVGIIALLAVATLWSAGLMFQWGSHLVPARGPVSFSEIVHNQFFVVPRQLSADLQRYLFKRKALMQQIEDRDVQQLKNNPPPP